MRRTTSLAAAVAVALCSLTFAACGGDDSSSDSSSGKVEGEISLLAPEYSDNTEGWWKNVISAFEKKYPGAKVKLQMVSWTDINQKITTLVSTNQAPDVLNLDAYANFAGDDLLLPADEVLSPKTQDDFIDKFAENGKFDGTQTEGNSASQLKGKAKGRLDGKRGDYKDAHGTFRFNVDYFDSTGSKAADCTSKRVKWEADRRH